MKYFTFTEMERSDTAVRHAIDNTAPESARKNIAVLVDTVLDPLREAWGKPISVTSGYRCRTEQDCRWQQDFAPHARNGC